MNNNLSIVILTHDEADNITWCLKSITWCKDIILIDNSTDKTIEIARKTVPKNNLRIIKDSEKDNFSYLRNLGLKLAKNNWVLFLDADEKVTSELQQEILIKIRNYKYSGYYLRRQDYFLGKWLKYGETGNLKLLKLGKKNAGVWKRAVHEVWDIQGIIGEFDHPIRHFPHPTISEFISRINRWTTLDAQVFYEQGKRSGFIKIIVYPVGKFILNYFLKLGFLDGIPGLILAMLMSFHSFLTRGKLYFLQKRE